MATKTQSGSQYLTLSLTCRIFEHLLSHFEEQLSSDDSVLAPLARKMNEKLSSYSTRIKTPLAHVAKILDSRIRNDIMSDGDILRKDIPLASLPQSTGRGNTHGEVDLELSTKYFFVAALEENGLQVIAEDDVPSSCDLPALKIVGRIQCDGGILTRSAFLHFRLRS